MDKQLKRNAPLSAFGSDYNALDFFVRSVIRNSISTAIPVVVTGVTRNGSSGRAEYVSALPLITSTDADGNAIEPVEIPKMPFFRLQHGTAAIVCDPVVGDVGLAIFAQKDVSGNDGATEPRAPATFRTFDMSDGFYLGGFFGKKPETFIHIEQSGEIVINCANATVNASGNVKTTANYTEITAPSNKINGTLTVTGLITGTGGLAISGGSGASVTGSMTTTGDVKAGGISLMNHTHPCGSSTTGKPQ